MSGNAIYLATVWAIPVITAITFHEAAHGFVAHLLGDDTAWRLGRVSFNPAKHIDPFGTIILPGILLLLRAPFLFGYAKPVPVNFRKLRSPRRDMVLVAAAGPAMNIALAVLAALAFHLVGYLPVTAAQWGNPDRSPYHFADAGRTAWDRSRLLISPDRHRDWRHHRCHHPCYR